MKISEMVDLVHDNAVNKGFWDKRREVGTLLMLVVSELAEALEAHRNRDMENFAEELADTVIRVADIAGGLNIDLEMEIVNKMVRNKHRPRLHGKEY